MATADFYRWVLDALAPAACVTVVRGLEVGAVVEALGGDPSSPPQPRERLGPASEGVEVAAVGAVGDVVVAVEPGGCQGCRPEVIRPASRGGLAASVFWNRAGVPRSRYAFAQEGELVGTFEPGCDRIPEAFVRAERSVGAALGPDHLLGIGDVWTLVPVLDELRPAPPVRYHPLWRADRGAAEAAAAATPEGQRRLALEAARRAAAASSFDREPGVAEVLATGQMTTAVAGLVRRNPTPAALTVYRATNPDPLAAALDAILWAGRA